MNSDACAAKIIRPEILAPSSYHVAPAAGMIKLDAMENPFAFPAELRAGLAEALAGASLNRYPPAAAAELCTGLRRALAIPPELDILLGNGSDEIIQLIALAAAKPGAALLSVEPAFVMFRMIASFCGLRYCGVPLNPDFSLDTPAVLAAIARERPAVTFIAYPNNPTGNLFDRDSIREIMAANAAHGGLVVIDEAYFAFSAESFLVEIARHPNAVLMRTVSKLGLAGLRLGLLIGRREWLGEFDKLRLPYNINSLTQAIASRVLSAGEALQAQADIIVAERARVFHELAGIEGVKVFRSQANFLLLRVPDAVRTFEGLKGRQILIKNLHGAHPLLDNCLRVTIVTPAENDAFLNVLSELL